MKTPMLKTPMLKTIRKTITHPALAISSTLLWGIVEFVALQRSARMGRGGSSVGIANTTDRQAR
ncbi:MAG: hypothetical protein JWL63_1481 [Rhodocyclales bacterium]|nr:hypothetical protein [Rhodocyclales bacterium]